MEGSLVGLVSPHDVISTIILMKMLEWINAIIFLEIKDVTFTIKNEQFNLSSCVKYAMLSAQRIEFISLMPNTLNHMQLVLMGFAWKYSQLYGDGDDIQSTLITSYSLT